MNPDQQPEFELTPAHFDPETGEIVDSQSDPISLHQLEGALLAVGFGYEINGLVLNKPLEGDSKRAFIKRIELWGEQFSKLALKTCENLPGMNTDDSQYILECYKCAGIYISEISRQLFEGDTELAIDRDTLAELLARVGKVEVPGLHVELSIDPPTPRIELLSDTVHIYSAHGAHEIFRLYAENVSDLSRGPDAEQVEANIRAHIYMEAECDWNVNTEDEGDFGLVYASRAKWIEDLLNTAPIRGFAISSKDLLRYEAALNSLRCHVATTEFEAERSIFTVTAPDGYEYSDFNAAGDTENLGEKRGKILARCEELMALVSN